MSHLQTILIIFADNSCNFVDSFIIGSKFYAKWNLAGNQYSNILGFLQAWNQAGQYLVKIFATYNIFGFLLTMDYKKILRSQDNQSPCFSTSINTWLARQKPIWEETSLSHTFWQQYISQLLTV